MRLRWTAAAWPALTSAQVIAVAILLAVAAVIAWARWVVSGAGGPGAPELRDAPARVTYPADPIRAQELARRGRAQPKVGVPP